MRVLTSMSAVVPSEQRFVKGERSRAAVLPEMADEAREAVGSASGRPGARRDGNRGGARDANVWRQPAPDHPFTAEAVHDQLRRQAWLAPVRSEPTNDYLLDVLERR